MIGAIGTLYRLKPFEGPWKAFGRRFFILPKGKQ
jgi:hypothetical protein